MPRDTHLRRHSRGRSRSRSYERDDARNFKSLARSEDVPDKDRRAGHTKTSRSRSSSRRRRVRSSSRSRRSRSPPPHRKHDESDKRRKRRRHSRSSSSAATSSSEDDTSSLTDSSGSLDGRRHQNHRRRHHHDHDHDDHHRSHKHKHRHKHKRHDKRKHDHKHKHHRKKHKKQHPRVDPLVKAYEDQVIREIKEWQQQRHQAKGKRGSGDSGITDDGRSLPWPPEFHNEEQRESAMPKRPPMMPQTKQEYDAEQSVVREVVDPIDGRMRLIKGTGEVLERIVTREEHLQINKQATIGDGLTYQRRWMGGDG